MKKQWLLLLAIFVTTIGPHGGVHQPWWEFDANPVNPRAKVDFAIPHDAMVSIRAYDIHGRLATTLVGPERMTAGTHSTVFEGARLASGVYLVVFRVEGEKALVKRVTVLK
jgi:hypothetical protein